ncbi:MAG: flippase-like domain-containing protein [Candidatus Aenigmatarchaeota archaeon]|nr:MAG: flippase-like domain-containing protein [Candidatus Aenigmarchaeota archaeon]
MVLKRYAAVFLFLLGIVAVVVEFNAVGLGQLAPLLISAPPNIVALAFAAFILSSVAWTLRWKVFVQRSGYNVPFASMYANLFVGMAVNGVTPLAKFAGEPVRAYLLKRECGVPMRVGLATVAAELSVDALVSLTAMFVAVATAAFVIGVETSLLALMIAGLVAATVVIGVFVSLAAHTRFAHGSLKWLSSRSTNVRSRVHDLRTRIVKFQKVFKESLSDPRALSIAVATTLAQRFFDMLRFALVLAAVGANVGLPVIVVVLGVSLLLSTVPSTPGGLGLMEGGMIGALVLLGVPLHAAAAAVIIERLISYWIPLAAGLVLGSFYGASIVSQNKGI